MKVFVTPLFIALAFCACRNTPTPTISTETLDTVKTVPAKITAEPVLLETAFVKGTQKEVNNATVNFYGVTIGKIKVSSGRIVACDPWLTEEYGKPFTQVFPSGEFPVQLSIAQFENGGTLAFARIYFSDAPVERWETALLEGQSASPVGSDTKQGYVVDSGIGSFMDEETSKALNQGKAPQFGSELYKEMDKHYHHRWRYTLYNVGEHNLAAFSSGFGDGRYSTYIGFDAKGQPCRLVTDFALFDKKKK